MNPVTSVTPPCPECAAPTEPLEVEGEQIWCCPACGRRTYGTDDPNDDDNLPSYSEVDEDGRVSIYHGDGTPDFEATAEYPQDDDGDEDELDDEEEADPDGPPAPTGWEPEAREIRVKDLPYVLAGGWVRIYSSPPEGWRHFAEAVYDPDHDATVRITYSDGEVVREDPWPQALLVHAGPDTVPTATRPGPAGLVKR